jgi:hypothetical protein
MIQIVKVGIISLAAVLVVALLVLRATGLEPADVPRAADAGVNLKRFVRPGLWIKGDVVRTPVTDWSFVNKVYTCVLETQTSYLIPHSVRVGPFSRNGQLYIASGQVTFDKKFPADKAWTSEVARDPRVRLKIRDKIYELTLVLIADDAEVEKILHHKRDFWEKGADGQPRLDHIVHLFHAYQRNIPEYSSGQSAALSSGFFVPDNAP